MFSLVYVEDYKWYGSGKMRVTLKNKQYKYTYNHTELNHSPAQIQLLRLLLYIFI